MDHVDAIFQQGVFKPLQPVSLEEDQRVHLHIEPAIKETPLTWLDRVRVRQKTITEREGTLPDSTGEIALDRQR